MVVVRLNKYVFGNQEMGGRAEKAKGEDRRVNRLLTIRSTQADQADEVQVFEADQDQVMEENQNQFFEADQDHFFEADQDQVFQAGKSATEIADACSDQKTGEPPGGTGVLASIELVPEDKSAITGIVKTDQVFEADQEQGFEAGHEDDKSATEVAKTCNDQKTGEPPSGAGVMA